MNDEINMPSYDEFKTAVAEKLDPLITAMGRNTNGVPASEYINHNAIEDILREEYNRRVKKYLNDELTREIFLDDSAAAVAGRFYMLYLNDKTLVPTYEEFRAVVVKKLEPLITTLPNYTSGPSAAEYIDSEENRKTMQEEYDNLAKGYTKGEITRQIFLDSSIFRIAYSLYSRYML